MTTGTDKLDRYKNWCRYYNDGPEMKTVGDCRHHGIDHKAYGWCPQLDPRWSDEQRLAYIDGYESHSRGLRG